MAEDSHGDPVQKWALTDLILGSLTMLLQMDKLRQRSNEQLISSRSVRAARQLLDMLAMFDASAGSNQHYGGMRTYFVAFYPFRAFFCLYHHILASDEPKDYQDDVHRLEKVGSIFNNAARTRLEYIPIAKAIASLNRIARHVQQQRIMTPEKEWGVIHPQKAPELAHVSVNVSSEQSQMAAPTKFHFPSMPGLVDMQLPSIETFQEAVAQPDFEPITYLHTIENDFTFNMWNNGWWNPSGDGTMDRGQVLQ